MGNRRLGAKRLNALQKRGEQKLDTSLQAGAGIEDAVVSHRVFKEGRITTVEILVDLQGKTGGLTLHSPNTDGNAVGGHNAASDANEVAAIAAAVEGCHLMKWNNATYGRFFESEVIVVETPAAGGGGEAHDIDVEFATFAAGNKLNTTVTTSLALAAHASALATGDRFVIPADDADTTNPEVTSLSVADQDGKGLYLTADDDNPGLPYTGGKLMITLRGYDESWGF